MEHMGYIMLDLRYPFSISEIIARKSQDPVGENHIF